METRLSLLERAVSGDEATWRRLVAIYQPLIRGWLLAQGVVPQDADDLAQEVMAILVRELPKFDHAGRPGSFRAWLRTIAVNQARKFWRAGRCRVAGAAGGSFTLASLDELADSASDLAKAWDAEHDRHIYRRLLAILETEFEPMTIQVFRRLVIDQHPAGAVSAETGLSLAAVYGAKFRVMTRFRQEAAGIIE